MAISLHVNRFFLISRKVSTKGQLKLIAIAKENFCTSLNIITPATACDEKYRDYMLSGEDDLSHLTPNYSKSFNVAAYVNASDYLQKFIKMNVNLSKIEKKPHLMQKLLRLDFEKDIKGHIFFLNDYVNKDDFGNFISKNPMIFYQSLDDLKVRINYLMSKNFNCTQIQRIISQNPFWLMFSTKRIDRRLGFFQSNFKLTSDEVKYLATKQPRLITYNIQHIKTNNFVIKEEMGFQHDEIKALLLNKPRLWFLNQLSLSRRFNYIHNVMKISHNAILNCPNILLSREFRIKQRHVFLEKLGRAQFNPKKENYIPIIALVAGTDVEFCRDYAKCTIDDYNTYLKTL